MRKITKAEIEAERTPKGGFTRATLAQWGVPWPPPRGWRKALINGEEPPMELADDFKPDDFEILYDNGRGKVIVAYGNSYKGSRTFHIRCLFEDANGKWRPAKEGVSVPLSDKAVFLAAIADKA